MLFKVSEKESRSFCFIFVDHPNWKDFYPDAEEEIPHDLAVSKGP
jgi:hypothetical protein